MKFEKIAQYLSKPFEIYKYDTYSQIYNTFYQTMFRDILHIYLKVKDIFTFRIQL